MYVFFSLLERLTIKNTKLPCAAPGISAGNSGSDMTSNHDDEKVVHKWEKLNDLSQVQVMFRIRNEIQSSSGDVEDVEQEQNQKKKATFKPFLSLNV